MLFARYTHTNKQTNARAHTHTHKQSKKNTLKSSLTFTCIILAHIDIALNSSKKTTKKPTNYEYLNTIIIIKKTNLINNQLVGLFLFSLVLKQNTFMTFPHQTPKYPKPIKTFTKLTTSDLNIKTKSLCHSIKNESPLSWSLATHTG